MAVLSVFVASLGCVPPASEVRGKGAPGRDPTELTGTWKFVCCGGQRSGSIELRQDGARISGVMREDGVAPQVLQGSMEGSRVLLHPQGTEASLTYEFTFDARCRVLSGILRANVVQATYPEVVAVSEEPPRGAGSCPRRELPPPRRCFSTEELAPGRCTGIPYDMSQEPPRYIRVCNACLTDEHCTEKPGGRCLVTFKGPCAGDGARACAYPGERCHPGSAVACAYCYNNNGRAVCGPPPQMPPSRTPP